MDEIALPKHTIDAFERRWSRRVSRPFAKELSADQQLARLRAHRNNILRYRRLLETNLTEVERQFIERRLEEERIALGKLCESGVAISPVIAPGGQALATGEHRYG